MFVEVSPHLWRQARIEQSKTAVDLAISGISFLDSIKWTPLSIASFLYRPFSPVNGPRGCGGGASNWVRVRL